MGEKICKGELVIKLSGLGNSKRGYHMSVSETGVILEQVLSLEEL
jgi:hypothetical protein